MSTRICIPFTFENMTIRSPNSSDRRTLRKTEKVRRVLFAPVDHAETERFVETELAMQRTYDMERWGFDFEREVPLATSERYVWKPVLYGSSPAPASSSSLGSIASYSIDVSPVKRKRSSIDADDEEPDNSDCYPPPLAQIVSQSIFNRPSQRNNAPAAANRNKKQCLITDFMKIRKQTSETTKKIITMSSSPNSSAPTSSSSSSTTAICNGTILNQNLTSSAS